MSNQIPKHLQEKKKHHYVWAYYLKHWSTDGKNVWRTTKKNKKVETYSVNGMLYEDFFYKIHDLDNDHIKIINYLFFESHPSQKKMIEQFIGYILLLQKSESSVGREQLLANSLLRDISIFRCNTLENLHFDIEKAAKPIIDSLANEDLSILDSSKNMMDFVTFLGHQMTRTKSIKEVILTNISKKNKKLGNKLEECWWIVSYFMGTNLGFSLFASKDNDYHCLLINNSTEPFITSDYPVINIHPALENNNLKPLDENEMDLYYPISPTIAYMINNSNNLQSGKVNVSLETVCKLNEKIAKNSNIHIIGNNEQIINKYKKYTGNWMNFIRASN